MNAAEFSAWLRQMPAGNEQTINLPITLETETWCMLAQGCAKHGVSLEQAVSRMFDHSDLIAEWANNEFPAEGIQ